MLRMRELVDETPHAEYTPTAVLYELLAPNNDQPENPSESRDDSFSRDDTSNEE